MDFYQYYTNNSFFIYKFESHGQNGTIRKVARFTELGPNFYNFGFADLDPVTGRTSDTVVSNNGDSEKIMATVARILVEFTDRFPNVLIFIKGSTPARTRFYQIALNKYWNNIDTLFDVRGAWPGAPDKPDKWESFRKGVNYNAFLGRRRT